MALYKLRNGVRIQLTKEEMKQREKDERAWLAEKAKPKPPTLEERVAALEAIVLNKGVNNA